MSITKDTFQGKIISVQPRIRLTRSFDQRFHNYLGYSLRIEGKLGEQKNTFLIGIGKAAQAKHSFQAGDVISGECLPVPDPRLEPVDFYKVSKLKIIRRTGENQTKEPPWEGVPPTLEEYRRRGHRHLAARTYGTRCIPCIWGCHMAVEIIVDHWKPNIRKYRYETFCYGPKSCKLYKPGSIRKVQGRHGMVWIEEDWVDEDETSHRE
ncbi:MAG: hypothetical protein GX262_13815 [Clostridia bacterium]|nr:hypothetical protein [Clostridia bacterium]